MNSYDKLTPAEKAAALRSGDPARCEAVLAAELEIDLARRYVNANLICHATDDVLRVIQRQVPSSLLASQDPSMTALIMTTQLLRNMARDRLAAVQVEIEAIAQMIETLARPTKTEREATPPPAGAAPPAGGESPSR